MKIALSWVESLQVFKPANFKLFLLVTLKSIIETYKILFTKFWWVFLGFVAMDYVIAYSVAYNGARSGLLLVTDFYFVLILFLMFLVIRPSVQQKNVSYVQKYWKQFMFFLVFGAVFGIIVAYISGTRFQLEIGEDDDIIYLATEGLSWIGTLLLLAPAIVTGPLFVITNSFLFDTNGSLKAMFFSLWGGIKFCVYNYPFCILGLLLFHYLFQAIDGATFFVLGLFDIPLIAIIGQDYVMLPALNTIKYVSMLFWPIPLCFFINFYVKRLHEQFELYFEKKGA